MGVISGLGMNENEHANFVLESKPVRRNPGRFQERGKQPQNDRDPAKTVLPCYLLFYTDLLFPVLKTKIQFLLVLCLHQDTHNIKLTILTILSGLVS